MSKTSGLSVSKPASVWNKAKSINADWRELFKSLGKAGIDGCLGKWEEVAKNLVEASASLGLAEEPEEIAWVLIYRSLLQAMLDLLEGNRDLLMNPAKLEDLETICEYRLDLSLEQEEIKIDREFFQQPKKLKILESIKTPFSQLLENFLGVSKVEAIAIANRLPTYFVLALHQEWGKHTDKYACLKEKVDTPFTKANQREQAWQIYSAWLQKQVEEPMFTEAFGLKQVFVPLNAYYCRKIEDPKVDDFDFLEKGEKREERVVVELEKELDAWLKEANKKDAIRVISGGPGSGKSSFAKIFAAKQSEKGEIPVLFIPLHHFDPSDDLVEAIGKFVRVDPDGILPPNPLLEENSESCLLIIFDGLDELAMQGKVGIEVAQNFVREIQRQVSRFNNQKTRLMVILGGRELVVQANSADFRQPKQLLNILPYFVDKNERKKYVDDDNLLEQDKRQTWWESYGKSKGFDYPGLPNDLNRDNLTEITSQPLLNYLVALSYAKGEVEFTEDINLNLIYGKLLHSVYERAWDYSRHRSIQEIDEPNFIRILEEIALAAWHGDGRKTTVKDIENHCNNSGLKNLLDIFQSGAKTGVTRLLTAFYFRKNGFNDKQGEDTFEFTHKSFGEYLTAKRIVREVKLIHRDLEARKINYDKGCDEKEALKRWAFLCGASAMDKYIFNFVLGEMRLHNKTNVAKWQKTLCHLMSFMLRHGMPMEELSSIPNFHEENRQAINAEGALLVVVNACARVTEKLSKINWNYQDKIYGYSFISFIGRLLAHQETNYISAIYTSNTKRKIPEISILTMLLANWYRESNCIYLNYLSFLDLQKIQLSSQNLSFANLNKVNFKESNLSESNFSDAFLEDANFANLLILMARFERANLHRANFKNTTFYKTSLTYANLTGANLTEAKLIGTNLTGANLTEAKLIGTNLTGANLTGTNLTEVDFAGADLTDVNLKDANLTGAKNLDLANLKGTILEGKDLTSFTQDLDENE